MIQKITRFRYFRNGKVITAKRLVVKFYGDVLAAADEDALRDLPGCEDLDTSLAVHGIVTVTVEIEDGEIGLPQSALEHALASLGYTASVVGINALHR